MVGNEDTEAMLPVWNEFNHPRETTNCKNREKKKEDEMRKTPREDE
jgi:hypothetical protein